MLNLQAFPFVLYKSARCCYFPIFVPFLSPVCPFFVPRFLYLCMWDKKRYIMRKKKEKLFQTAEELIQGYGLKGNESEKTGNRKVLLRGKALSSENVSLYLSYCSNGKRAKEYLGNILKVEISDEVKAKNKETLRQVIAIANEKDSQIQREQNGFSIGTKAKINLIEYVIKQSDEALKKTGNKYSYYYILRSLAKHLQAYSGDKVKLGQVDEKYIIGFIGYLRTAKNLNYTREGAAHPKEELISENTQHRLCLNLRYVLNAAAKAKLIPYNPFLNIDSKEIPATEEDTREFLTVAEVKRLIATPIRNEVIKKAFLFAVLTGLRYSDLKTITWGEITKDDNNSHLIRFKMKKVKRLQTVYLSDEALKWLPGREGTKDNDVIFNLPKNDSANRQLARWVKLAGITKTVTFHVGRHTAATLLLNQNVPIATVSKFLGHTKISTTEIYAKVLNESVKKAVSVQDGLFD